MTETNYQAHDENSNHDDIEQYLTVTETVNHGFDITDSRLRRLQWILGLVIVTQVILLPCRLFWWGGGGASPTATPILAVFVGVFTILWMSLLRYVLHKFDPLLIRLQQINNGFPVLTYKETDDRSWQNHWRIFHSGVYKSIELDQIEKIQKIDCLEKKGKNTHSRLVATPSDVTMAGITVLLADNETVDYCFDKLLPYIVRIE